MSLHDGESRSEPEDSHARGGDSLTGRRRFGTLLTETPREPRPSRITAFRRTTARPTCRGGRPSHGPSTSGLRHWRPREWRPQLETLSPKERDEVISAGLCQLRPVGEDRYELRPESTVGTAVGKRVRLVVRPKIGVRNVFFLLSYATGLTSWRHDERFPYEEDDDLFSVVASFFEAEVARAEGHGLARDYRSREEPLPTLRGRIDIGTQVTRRLGQPFPIECRYEEYTELNRVLKACFRGLLSLPGPDPELVRRLRHRARAFEGVETVDYVAGSLPTVCRWRSAQPGSSRPGRAQGRRPRARGWPRAS